MKKMSCPVRYRLNRAEGKIYRQAGGNLLSVGESLDAILLYATEPIWGTPYPEGQEQHWVQLCFLDPHFNWSYALLNSGKSNALNGFFDYQQQLQLAQKSLWEVTTTIRFLPQETNARRCWYHYQFTEGEGLTATELQNRLNAYPKEFYSLLDRSLNLPLPPEPEHPVIQVDEIDERASFLVWGEGE